MTVANEVYRMEYAGNGVTTEFAITFYFLIDADIKAVLSVDATGVETVLTLTTHYTLAGAGEEAGGALTMLTEPATGETLTILRSVDYKQETAYTDGGSFPAEDHETALDKLTMQNQQLQEELDRALKLSPSQTSSPEVPFLVAGRAIQVNDAADGVQMSDYNPDTQQAAAAASAAAALVSENAAAADVVLTNADVVLAEAAKDAAETAAGIVGVKGADIASANPLAIGADGNYFDITGVTGFASMTVAADRFFTLQFDGILTMTHHATNLDLPGGANITTAAGDVAIFQSTGANTVQCVAYTRANGTSVVTELSNDASPALGGTLEGGDNTAERLNLLDCGIVTNAIGSLGGGAVNIDIAAGNNQSATVDTAPTTITFTNPTASDELCIISLYLTNAGSQTLAFTGLVTNAGDALPTFTTSGLDFVVFATMDGGTTWLLANYKLDIQAPA